MNFLGMTESLISELEQKIPTNGLVQVILPIHATDGIRRSQVAGIKRLLAEWIVNATHRLKEFGDRSSILLNSTTREGNWSEKVQNKGLCT